MKELLEMIGDVVSYFIRHSAQHVCRNENEKWRSWQIWLLLCCVIHKVYVYIYSHRRYFIFCVCCVILFHVKTTMDMANMNLCVYYVQCSLRLCYKFVLFITWFQHSAQWVEWICQTIVAWSCVHDWCPIKVILWTKCKATVNFLSHKRESLRHCSGE